MEYGPEIIELEPRHREAMLDLILTWASLDGALSMLLANVRGSNWVEVAEDIRKLRGSAKLAEVARQIKCHKDGAEAAAKLRKIKKRYEKYSRLRDHIAHSRCVGASKASPEFVVFLTFERVAVDKLAVYQVPLEEMNEAVDWGKDLLELLFRWTRIRP